MEDSNDGDLTDHRFEDDEESGNPAGDKST